ncbi:MAG: cation transporter [Nitrospirae bacterium]|nr:MAG: cation transporter [Nitrospirota bacterium]
MKKNSQNTVLALTVAYFFVELAGGLYYHSLALITDASFMALNVSGQIIALYIERLSKRLPDKSRTFGYERAKVLSGLFNGLLVGFLAFYVVIEAYQKVMVPERLEADKILMIAVIGLFVNAFGLLKLYRHAGDINIKGCVLLILNDTLGSIGVIISSIIIHYTDMYFLDPLTGVVVGLLAAYPTYFLIKDSVHILMEGNPAKTDSDDVMRLLKDHFDDITHVKDIHIWALSPEKVILAARVRTSGQTNNRKIIRSMKKLLMEHFGFFDVYIEGYEAERNTAKKVSDRNAALKT